MTGASRVLASRILVVSLSGVLLAGCQTGGFGRRPATATTPVASTNLPPVTIQPTTPNQTLEQAVGPDGQPLEQPTGVPPDAETEVAALPDPAAAPDPAAGTSGGTDLTEDDLIGVWSASTGGIPCSLNLSLTSWTGGYRASARNCGDPVIAGVQAWNVAGRQVLLFGEGGAPLATLYATQGTRYSGQTATGRPISLSR
ncbi:MAG: AprI/Inh family metalloprotease inhibitor [Hyphomicrobiaceae bacterium]|nr:AprI/Inh family metalloprotease inhibitor [Hyphomicrobiaceae bacterium]